MDVTEKNNLISTVMAHMEQLRTDKGVSLLADLRQQFPDMDIDILKDAVGAYLDLADLGREGLLPHL